MVRMMIASGRLRHDGVLRPRRRGAKRVSKALRRGMLGLLAATGVACTGAVDEGKLPPGVQDPETLKTPGGAIARYRGALAALAEALDHYLTTTGILTDELAANPAPIGTTSTYTGIDSRIDLALFEDDYNLLHRVRGQAREARGFVLAYARDSSSALAGHLYAVEGYAEVLLADLFCSGIPLSTVDFDGNYTFAAGSSTNDVYRHAIALFDTALTLEGDSAGLQYFTAVGRGRALLALGRYAEAAAAVTSVPDNYAYRIKFTPTIVEGSGILSTNRLLASFTNGLASAGTGYLHVPATPGMADSEGGNGLNYRSSGDPRTPTKLEGPDALGKDYYFPGKYPDFDQDNLAAPVTITVVDDVEARLIEAEAALQGNATDGQWLAKLNSLRRRIGLADTTGPDTDTARVSLLFRERAFWLYLTGHRQGDMRRLVRNYLRESDKVYPANSYPGASGFYGDAVAAPVPQSERELNPKYTGCLTFGA